MVMTSEEIRAARNKLWKAIEIEDYSVCYHCKTKGLKEDDFFCPICRFPQRGTQDEMRKFLQDMNRKHDLVHEKQNSINKARYVLFGLSFINLLLGTLIGFFSEYKSTAFFIASAIVAGIYLALGLWSIKKPFAAIITGFFVYIIFVAINAIGDPHTLYQGLFWKALIISAFVYGYLGAKDADKLEKELNDVLQAKDLS